MLNCKQASALLSQSQDRPLGLFERLGLRLHLALCDGCTNFRRQLALMRAAIRRLRDDG
jgi:Putative zinc-finger